MSHRLETKVGQNVSYQLQVTGTEPVACSVILGNNFASIDTSKRVTINGSQLTSPGVYDAIIKCTNCNGAESTLQLQISVTEDVNCTPITPPAPVLQQFVYNSTPVKVPNTMVGIHASTYNENTGVDYPQPDFAYDFMRSHDGTTKPNSGADSGWAGAGMMWRAIERSPGQYTMDLARKWANAYPDKKILWTLFGCPDFYAKYNDANAAAMSAQGFGADDMLYPGSGSFNSPPSDPQKIVDFARALINDPVLGPRIFAFELWNEAMLPVESNYSRWNAAWGRRAKDQGWFNMPQPWYCGTADEMATMAKMLREANLGRPLMACGFVDCHNGVAGQYSFDRMLNGAASGGGQMKDYLDAVSVHWYDYDGENLNKFVAEMTNYRSRLDNLGKANLPLWNTETGDFAGTMSPTQVGRLITVAAATRLQSMTLYKYSEGSSGQHMGNPVTNAQTRAAITAAHDAVSGKTICEAAILQGGQVWVHTSDGRTYSV